MTTKLQELELQLAKYKAQAQVWEQAFRLLAQHGVFTPEIVRDELLKGVKNKKTVAENFEAGEEYAEKHILSVYDKDMEVQLEAMEKGEIIGVQNAFFAGVASYLKQLAAEYIIGALTKLLKENAIKLVDWLLGQTEDVIIKGYDKLSEEDKFLFKNQLKEYPRFGELLKKIE